MTMLANGPTRIAAMKEALAELKRHERYMEEALRTSNDEAHHRYFDPLLKLLRLIISNEAAGNTQFLADDLYNFRSALRRFKLPDLDPVFETPTQALLNLRGARGNLLEALETALETAADLGLVPSQQQGALVFKQSIDISELLVRLDERLRGVEENLADMKEAALAAEKAGADVSQTGLINLNLSGMSVEVTAARFETKVASDISLGTGGDLSVLARSIDNLSTLASDLGEKTKAFAAIMADSVKAVALATVKGAQRVQSGFATVVSSIRRRRDLAMPPDVARQRASISRNQIQNRLDMALVHEMILAGNSPPQEWWVYIVKLNFFNKPLNNLTPLEGLTALRSLDLWGTQVGDLAPLAGLARLQVLNLGGTKVYDLSPLSGLVSLQSLDLWRTQVRDLAPLSRLTALQHLDLRETQVSDLTPLEGLIALQSLDIVKTTVSDLTPIVGLPNLEVITTNLQQKTNFVSSHPTLAGKFEVSDWVIKTA